ncbi:MAG: bifunctional UDP-N-acetylmuramoyl-tripeptide:D-alanyl-D-alanine ligase/alanine racemase [Bernardetiaceae bacterium]|nr:bifunctional UDP-N-acetylmuramoyl-tripeptide:D-alanyl-D-alanine ligase/alanine racemase [Bernardetiaceae bacterium]
MNNSISQLYERLKNYKICIDSRRIVQPSQSVFFALKGKHHDGHDFVRAAYKESVRYFVIHEAHLLDFEDLAGAHFFVVENPLLCLQELAAYHRQQFSMPLLAITGSNGKTIVKEWLYQLLNDRYQISKSPKSYNSQVGVPLSLWQLQSETELAILEAGISERGEMDKLTDMLAPTEGIFTNIGTAHDNGFASLQEKIQEKIKLFKGVKTLIFRVDNPLVYAELQKLSCEKVMWSWNPIALHKDLHFRIQTLLQDECRTELIVSNLKTGKDFLIRLPFADVAQIENALHCMVWMLIHQFTPDEVRARISGLRNIPMRLELKNGKGNARIIDDSYNNDWGGLIVALDFMSQHHQKTRKTVILSDMLEVATNEERLYEEIFNLCEAQKITRFIGVGEQMVRFQLKAEKLPQTDFFATTKELEQAITNGMLHFFDETILIKGARAFEFERISHLLQQKTHGTRLEINLDALTHNLNFYRSCLSPKTKLMVMVKAFAYGNGNFEVANLLQFHGVDYLGVAFADEGVALRQNGIRIPIMVLNPRPESFATMVAHDLEPEMYSLELLYQFKEFYQRQYIKREDKHIKIHLKIDTGMHRLGFQADEIDALCDFLRTDPPLDVQVASVFSHLAASDMESERNFTQHQIRLFKDLATQIEAALGYRTLKHIANTAAITRFPEAHYDMVRLGIGLYGADQDVALKSVSSLKTTISQIKKVKAGDTVGYSRKGQVSEDMRIATIAIGYADGYDRRFSNGVGKVLVNGKLAPVIGNVCMDMTMIALGNIEAEVGDEVIIFGKDLPMSELAATIGTIPYEILTNVSERVKRVFHTE